MTIIKDQEMSIRRKVMAMYAGNVYDCACIFALREILTLTQEEFE